MKTTPLSLLLSYLHISAIDVAANIHVHPSLISRWKNGERHFDPQSEHFENVMNYILFRDERAEYRNIQVFLRDYYPNENLATYQNICDVLYRWLSGNLTYPGNPYPTNSASVENISVVKIIRGEREKKETLLNFLESALLLPCKKNIYIMIDKNTNEELDNASFYVQWIEKLNAVIKHGHTVYFIYYSYFFASFITNLKNFLSLCFNPQYHAFYMPKSGILSNTFNLFIIEDVLAITDFTPAENNKKQVLFSFTNPDIVSRLQAEYLNHLKACKPLVNQSIHNAEQFFIFLRPRLMDDPKIKIYDESPFLFPVKPSSFKKILDYNKFDNDTANSILERYTAIIFNPLMKPLISEERHRIIINIDIFQRKIKEEHQIFAPDFLSEKAISIPKNAYHLFLEEIIEYLSSSEYEDDSRQLDICFIYDSNAIDGKILDALTIFSMEGLFTYIHPHNTSALQQLMFFVNPTLVADSNNYLDNFWQNIPDENKDTKYMISRLNKILLEL